MPSLPDRLAIAIALGLFIASGATGAGQQRDEPRWGGKK